MAEARVALPPRGERRLVVAGDEHVAGRRRREARGERGRERRRRLAQRLVAAARGARAARLVSVVAPDGPRGARAPSCASAVARRSAARSPSSASAGAPCRHCAGASRRRGLRERGAGRADGVRRQRAAEGHARQQDTAAGPRQAAASTRSAAPSAAPPAPDPSASASAASTHQDVAGVDDSPIRPMRQTRPFHGPEPGADLDVVALEQPLANARPRRRRRERRRCSASAGDTTLRPPSSRPSASSPATSARWLAQVAREARFEPFLVHDAQRLVQRVDHRDRRGVVVDAVGAPVLLEQAHVEVPALHLVRASAQPRSAPPR